MSQTPTLSAATTAFLARPARMLVGADWVAAASGATLPVHDPATGGKIAEVPAGAATDVDRAVRAARAAFDDPAWAKMRPAERERLLIRLSELIAAHGEELAELETLENGKSINLSRILEVGHSVEFVRYMAGWATKLEGSTVDLSIPFGEGYHAFTLREPVGVVGAIIPWNFPLVMAVWKIAPALACGCTVVLKPAEETPLTALRLAELVLEAGFPAGVVNVVTGLGHEAGAALAAHPGIAKIAFTGSTEIGKRIGHAAVDNMTRFTLELGGKSPVIVLDDADPVAASAGAAGAIFFNNGQVCTAGSRLYVQRRIFERVVEGVAAFAASASIGPGLDPAAQINPLVSLRQQERVFGYVEDGIRAGARALCGADSWEGAGYFVRPTVLVDVKPEMRVVREEIFGPVLVAQPFDSLDEVVAAANDTPYGLGASIWSNDLKRVMNLIPRIQAGTVWINAHNLVDPHLPFGGFKQSGIGREMGRAALEAYTETKSVCIAL